ncbi:NAD(P)H-hydrate epimerase [Roseovarius rhodophyticola]|uniref:NAD(P)H-hydrate epimerase n=1 Tax=Roseovarius rhodophyticola TaxID=3080827 RepID=A0ABZ2TFQ7_9RHOB|nr:NAD(P)H-hydrate epimerase [Roseovarius sp. W115]MDV2928785.1 NAD(P)H-hydrate epimerase [Roseovarius sp. W115]
MTELLTAAQMRAIEQAAIESGEVTGLELMERAGRGVVDAVFEEWPELAKAPHRAVVLCGPGNNGGDGFVVARLLKEWGWEVEVFLYGDPDKLPPDAKVNYERWDGKTNAWGPNLVSIAGSADLLVDSLFGIGLNRPVPDEIWEEIAVLYGGPRPKRAVAIDVPSGLNGDTGLDPAEDCSIFVVDLTVTFHKKKVGHESNFGPDFCGKTVVKDIGL